MEGIERLSCLESKEHAQELIIEAEKHHFFKFTILEFMATQAYEEGDWETFGDAMGDLTEMVLDECD